MTTTKAQTKKLAEIVREGDKMTIKGRVASDALNHDDYAVGYLQDVCNHGCQSGTCSGLIYYTDTHAFYDEFADECDEVLEEYEQNTGEGFKFEGRDVRNTLAWMAYEEKAREVLSELGVEI